MKPGRARGDRLLAVLDADVGAPTYTTDELVAIMDCTRDTGVETLHRLAVRCDLVRLPGGRWARLFCARAAA